MLAAHSFVLWVLGDGLVLRPLRLKELAGEIFDSLHISRLIWTVQNIISTNQRLVSEMEDFDWPAATVARLDIEK